MKRNKVIFWTATIVIFLFEGIMPLSTLLFAPQYATAGTKPLGYPDYFAYSLIIFKLLGSFAILIPKVPIKLKEWAYAGLTFNLIFAIISHIAIDGMVAVSFFPLIIFGILAVSYIYNQKNNANA
jgi:hypothetical protein